MPHLRTHLFIWPVTFRNAAGVLTDPTVVTIRAVNPAGTVTSYVYGTAAQVTKTTTGSYTFTLPLTTAGPWRFDAIPSGAAVIADPSRTHINVLPLWGDT